MHQAAELIEKNNELKAVNKNLTEELGQTKSRASTLNDSYEKLKTESSEFLELKSNFQETASELSSKSAEVETLRKELSDLEMNRSIIWFVAGASVFLIGFLLGLSARRQRRKSPLR
jgi:SH3 domain protein